MAPEQIDGGVVTTRSDLYSLGLVLYELVTGQPGFKARSLGELFARRREELAPVPADEIVEDLDPVLARVIRRCLAPDAAERPASARAVAAALGAPTGLEGPMVRTLLTRCPGAPEDDRELLEQHGGQAILTAEGDHLVLFERPWMALQYTLAVRRRKAAHNRVGIHVSEVVVSSGPGEPMAAAKRWPWPGPWHGLRSRDRRCFPEVPSISRARERLAPTATWYLPGT